MIERRRIAPSGAIVATFSGSARQWAALVAAGVDGWDGSDVHAATLEIAAETHWWDGDGWALRPEHAAPAALTVAADAALGGFPPGFPATVTAPNGVAQDVTMPGDGALAFSAAGRWIVAVGEGWAMDPPRPERPAVWTIEVT